ncbi:alpha,alpha-trehalase TreF [Roseivirga sp. BDSF3-8]|uniref:alpha,alpha-trehalase TreF n=1 Tax=Roseivirga sp. BDSF3-8 TaxID=3241598 RepID=UPI00353232A1
MLKTTFKATCSLWALLCFITPACTTETAEQTTIEVTETDFYASQLFHDVQMARVFEDSKTFVDCTPKSNAGEIATLYLQQKETEGFELAAFVQEHFTMPETHGTDFTSDTSRSMQEHIRELWPVLTREPDAYNPRSSLLPLPNAYIVPGGRFREIYYWDSYFTMEGLMISDQEDMALNMVRNFAYLIDSLGFIPNGNRDYYLGRSQPPFFSLMAGLVTEDDRDLMEELLPAMQKEYDFWMAGADGILEGEAYRRVVKMTDGSVLNRYFDDKPGPRPESYREDYELVHSLDNPDTAAMYTHLRAGAESGWDYSSRWLADKQNLNTIHTTDIIPVDLNALLYHMEKRLAQGYDWGGDVERSKNYLQKAERRRKAIMTYLWDEEEGFFVDFDFKKNEPTGVLSMAGAYPLFFNIPDKKEGKKAAARLVADFLKDGGFITTLNETGQQWDAPNGWAPLQWLGVNGLYNYGMDEEAVSAAERWLERNREVYKATGKMMEKYNVVNIGLLAGGGEYGLQDGFGWTNGTALALMRILQDKKEMENMISDQD